MRICTAEKIDFNGIRGIWEERFTTDKQYLDTLFKDIMPLCIHYIAKEDETVNSVISLMPMKFIDDTKPGRTDLRGWYMFGVATKKVCEGKKYASSLIKSAIEDGITKGLDFIFERPANEHLTEFYIKLGFSNPIPKIHNNFCNETKEAKTLLRGIQMEFPKRFEWENCDILQGLINLGEIEEHNQKSSNPTPIKEYIYLNNLKGINPDTFSNTYFCFPME